MSSLTASASAISAKWFCATGRGWASPDMICRGFVYLRENADLLNEVRKRVRAIVERKTASRGPINWIYLKDEIKEKIGLFLFQKKEKRRMVLPVVKKYN